MKMKILKYGSYPRHNKVVTAYVDVTIINQYVGYYEVEKCEYNHDLDDIAIVLRVERLVFEFFPCFRKDLENTGLLLTMAERAKNLKGYIQELMNRNLFVSLMHIAVFNHLGWDAKPLCEYREDYIRRKESSSNGAKSPGKRL